MDSITPLVLRDDVALKDEERQPCEIWTRVMGYHRPVASFNRGKQGEYHERTYFIEGRASACCTERSGD
jgi:hypothetical protein